MNQPQWAFTKNANKTGYHMAHFVEQRGSGYHSDCGRKIKFIRVTLPGWQPEQNEDICCPECLKWYYRRVGRRILPLNAAGTTLNTQ